MMGEMDKQQRLAVARAEHKFSRGLISRRKFMSICMSAGFGFGGLRFLSGCKRDQSQKGKEKVEDVLGSRSAGTWASDQQKFLREIGKRFKGTTLRLVTESTPPSQAIKKLMEKEFIPLTGINVQWELLPLEKVLAQVVTDTALKTGKSDIYYWDQAWVGRFVDDAISPSELLDKKDLAYPGFDFDDILPMLVENIASYKGRMVGIPYDIPIFIMMYRKDIFEELGLKVPQTMREYHDVIKAIYQEKAPDVYGTTGQWKVGHYSLECNMTAWLWAHGGSIFGTDDKPAINDERAHAAMEYMMELGKYMPPGATNRDWSSEAEIFANGKAGIYISWGEYFPMFDDPSKSKIVGLAEAAPCPQEIALRTKAECSFDETPGISHQGGSCLAISKYSKNIEAAWIFLQWATSSDVTTRASLLGGGASPIRKSNYSDPRITAMNKVAPGTSRHFAVTLDAISNRMGTEPHLPAWANLSVDSFAVELGKMITRQQSISTTLNNMARDTEKAVKNKS